MSSLHDFARQREEKIMDLSSRLVLVHKVKQTEIDDILSTLRYHQIIPHLTMLVDAFDKADDPAEHMQA